MLHVQTTPSPWLLSGSGANDCGQSIGLYTGGDGSTQDVKMWTPVPGFNSGEVPPLLIRAGGNHSLALRELRDDSGSKPFRREFSVQVSTM